MRDQWDQEHWVATIVLEEDSSIDGMRAAIRLARHRRPDIFGAGWAVRAADDPEGVFAGDLATARALADVAAQLRTRYPRPTPRPGKAVPAGTRTTRRAVPA